MKKEEEEEDRRLGRSSHSHAIFPSLLRFPSPPSPSPSPGSDDDDSDQDAPTAASSGGGYSSCFYDGEEEEADDDAGGGASSEIDRYCSANSALGSASICSSSLGNYQLGIGGGEDRLSDDFGSPACCSPSQAQRRSFFFFPSNHADPDCFDRAGEGREVVPSSSAPSASAGRCEGSFFSLSAHKDDDSLPRIRTAPQVVDDMPSCGNPLGQEGDAAAASDIKEIASMDMAGLGSHSGYNLQNEINRDIEDDALSSYEHSEGEDSVGEFCADVEDHRTHLYGTRILQQPDKSETAIENPLSITSAVAFGSDDWDDFMMEVGEAGLPPLSLDQDYHSLQRVADPKPVGNLSSFLSNDAIISSASVSELKEGAIDETEFGRQLRGTNGNAQKVKLCPSGDLLVSPETVHLDAYLSAKCPSEGQFNFTNEREVNSSLHEVNGDVEGNKAAEMQAIGKQVPVKGSRGIQISSTLIGAFQERELGGQDGDMVKNQVGHKVGTFELAVDFGQSSTLPTASGGHPSSQGLVEDDATLNKVKKEDANELYDEMVLEMEEILLDLGISHGPKVNRGPVNHHSHHFRDGSSTASTSGTDEMYPAVQCSPKIDWVEVVGAKQKKGDVSFGERLVGVKEYSVYILRVWSANNQWEVERRYRDFFSLYRQLRTLFTAHGLTLPSTWSSVDKESRKFFGNASPDVVNERSALIQDCLRSVLSDRYPFGTPKPLSSFLNPGEVTYDSNLLTAILPQSLLKFGENSSPKVAKYGESIPAEDGSELGKTISLVVDNKPHKSMQQLLELQHYRCAGCHEPFHAKSTLLGELIQTLGWKKPRFCEYTSQLFCSSCHTSDTAVLPAKVLHLWDFSLYPVSQLAKAYLESIYDQPMLCVSAVNPFLFSKVPALLHIMGVRKKIGAMFPYVQCPFRRSILRSLGSRRYLLESNDFFALRDLVDLSKGAFAAFPVMVENISKRILEHITVQCLVCYDSGVPCAARQSCDDPSSLIFPFQEAEAARCSSCGSVYHNPCFAKLIVCPCSTQSNSKKRAALHEQNSGGVPLEPTTPSRQPADVVSKGRPDKVWKSTNRNSSPLILMGSLPSTSF